MPQSFTTKCESASWLGQWALHVQTVCMYTTGTIICLSKNKSESMWTD